MADNTPKKPLTPEEEIKQLKAQVAAQNEIIEGQSQQLQTSEAQADPNRVVVSHGGKQYLVRARKFSHEGQPVTAEQLKGNAELIKQLVEDKSGVLELIEKPAKAK